MGEDHDARPRDPGGGAVLCGRRDADAASAPPAGAAGTVPEITHRVRCLMLLFFLGWGTCSGGVGWAGAFVFCLGWGTGFLVGLGHLRSGWAGALVLWLGWGTCVLVGLGHLCSGWFGALVFWLGWLGWGTFALVGLVGSTFALVVQGHVCPGSVGLG